jgi:hypothetical protein
MIVQLVSLLFGHNVALWVRADSLQTLSSIRTLWSRVSGGPAVPLSVCSCYWNNLLLLLICTKNSSLTTKSRNSTRWTLNTVELTRLTGGIAGWLSGKANFCFSFFLHQFILGGSLRGGPEFTIINLAIFYRRKQKLTRIHLGFCGGNWVTENIGSGFLLPGDKERQDTRCSQMLQTMARGIWDCRQWCEPGRQTALQCWKLHSVAKLCFRR